VRVPAGEYALGPPESVHRADIAELWIDRVEVSVDAYGECVAAGACDPPAADHPACNWSARSERGGHPVNCVTWTQATAFCAWAGGRLPSEDEWEAAARGGDGRAYPWGEAEPAAQLCWNGPGALEPELAGTCPSGAFPIGASPLGALDMAGNVWEWTSTSEPLPDGGVARVYRGGGFEHDPLGPPAVRTTEREWMTEDYAATDLGFRCARSQSSGT
jgi:serine/threonine-protein kinase